MLTSRSQIWYTIFVGPFGARWAPSGPSGPPAFAGAAADKLGLRHCYLLLIIMKVSINLKTMSNNLSL